jgi:fumarate hydratase class I
MTVIRQDDLIDSVADALQFISYYHPVDFVQAVHQAYELEQNPPENRYERAVGGHDVSV